MKILIGVFCFFILAVMLSNAEAELPKQDQVKGYGINSGLTGDVWPWPWGTECPFPWENIEGAWQVKDSVYLTYFVFKVIYEDEKDGSRHYEIFRYNRDRELIAFGRGIAPKGKRIIRAAMHTVGLNTAGSYWAIVRAYVKQNENSCSMDSIVTAITIRPIKGSPEMDVHYRVEKVKWDDEFPQ